MDYAKYSYIKINEQEQYFEKDNKKGKYFATEFARPVVNANVTTSYTLLLAKAKMSGSVYLQNNILLSALASGTVKIELLVDNIVVSAETRELDSGETSVILMKAIEPKKKTETEVSVCVSVENNYAVKILSNTLAVIGEEIVAEKNAQSTMRVLPLSTSTIVSFIEDQKIYYADISLDAQTIDRNTFSWLANGISHCFSLDKSSNLHFFRVDSDGVLYHSITDSNTPSETQIATGASVVYAAKCPSQMSEDILVCYIKNNRPYFRTITNGAVSSECAFDAPKGKYVDISIADAPNAARMYVVLTNEKGSSYILTSEEDGLLSGFAETLVAGATMFVSRYYNMKDLLDDFSASINISASFLVKRSYLDYEELFSSGLYENILAAASVSVNAYEKAATNEILYTMQINQLTKRAAGVTKRVVYGADASSWHGAYYTFPSSGDQPGTLVDDDNLLSKWPFNEIKPCLMRNGEILGYLNKNNYAEFEDGTAADITSGLNQVMIQFPKIYWRFENDWDGEKSIYNSQRCNVTISVSNTPRTGFVCHSHTRAGTEYDYVYVCAYQSRIENGSIYCCSGKKPQSDITHRQIMQDISTTLGSEYSTLDYHFTTYLYILQMLLFQDYYGESDYGKGWAYTTAYQETGSLNTAGLFYGTQFAGYKTDGVTPVTGNTRRIHNKFFGLEDLWGNCRTNIDGILLNSDRKFMIIDPTNPLSTHNSFGINYTEVDMGYTSSYSYSNFVVLWKTDNTFGFLPMQLATSSSLKSYTECGWQIQKASEYNYVSANPDYSHMQFLYGCNRDYARPFGIMADKNVNVSNDAFHTERIMCYPTNKISN